MVCDMVWIFQRKVREKILKLQWFAVICLNGFPPCSGRRALTCTGTPCYNVSLSRAVTRTFCEFNDTRKKK